MSTKKKSSPDSIVREIKRKTRRKYSAEEKIMICLYLKRRNALHACARLGRQDSW
jgi:hypothetical protein